MSRAQNKERLSNPALAAAGSVSGYPWKRLFGEIEKMRPCDSSTTWRLPLQRQIHQEALGVTYSHSLDQGKHQQELRTLKIKPDKKGKTVCAPLSLHS